MVWHPDGLLNKYFGVKDFAGGTVVHMSAGFAALAGALVVGNRKIRIMNLLIFRMCFWEQECCGSGGLDLMQVLL
jgi:ammonia channel protein AmtB